MRPLFVLSVATCVWLGCTRNKTEPSDIKAGAKSDAGVSTNQLGEFRAFEYARDATKLSLVDVSSRSVDRRRVATRTLARIGDVRSRELLEHALHDTEREVVAWAAFGLGQLCEGTEVKTTQALVSRAGTLALESNGKPGTPEPFYAIAIALGRCATQEAENTLRSWLSVSPERARDASLGLTLLASTKKQLDARTLVALLHAVERYRGFAIGALPLTRLSGVDSTVARRLLELAPRLFESAGEERRFFIRALEHAGTAALPMLEQIVKEDAQYRASERSEAVRVLGKFGSKGQKSLERLLSRLLRLDQVPGQAWFLGEDFAVVFELLSQITSVDASGQRLVDALAKLEGPKDATPAMTRRLDWLRCHAATLSAGENTNAPLLEHCAVLADSREPKLAWLRVLSRSQIRGKALGRFESLLVDGEPSVRLEALRLLALHDEVRERGDRIARALRDKSAGVVATAAGLLVKRPELALKGERPNEAILDALAHGIAAPWPEDAIEVKTALMDAAGALGVLMAKPSVDKFCGSSVSTLRKHAEAALHRLGEPKRRCDVTTQTKPVHRLTTDSTAEVTLTFHTDLASLELRLDPKWAPLAVERLVTLAKAGFYDGLAVHRVVPGFVVQLGDQAGDGYGGAGMPPLPCELSPIPFVSGDVGMALSGSDSGSSQFFVTLGPYPQLGNDYSWVGRAGAGWDRLTVGDVVRKVELSR